MIHNTLDELIIGDECFPGLDKLIIHDFTRLNKFEIGDKSFQDVILFELCNCNKLNKLLVGANSFNRGNDRNVKRDGKLLIHDCSSLQEIEISGDSFLDYAGSFELKSIPFSFHIV